ncbi:MAG: asparagine synthase (glutamine-hydrolyzing) [Chloroflexi bacterium]|uniref:asparagine synthase (glutamine-hydrolyzing) n=1 Tax=Candidatus Flexifilum breve TaxID=3140694 RepID=UPI003134B5DB|nr:asparagine synthase (glutamine-hydrolyzing) [Chloroflexota bacterium]
MCGICGVVDVSGAGRANLGMVQRMCAAIRHRGPDGDGFYAPSGDPNVALGHAPPEHHRHRRGDQPLYNEDRTIALVFNGEIYNYKELRRDLRSKAHAFRTDGDGETIIHLYEEYGFKLFDQLRGMYGFALWDTQRKRLLVGVDHIGMKPLYLWERGGLLHFASEVKAFNETAELNLDVLDTYLSFGYMIGADTLFKGVQRLPAGHYLVAENGTTRIEEHWRFGVGTAIDLRADDEQGWITRARDLLTESVNLHMRSDVPVGLFLSGGVDSASVLALMRPQAESIETFTVGYDAKTPDNELIHARKIAAHFHTTHHERVINAEDWWNGFQRYVYHHDEPNANPSAVSLMLLAEETAKRVKVVLTGLGGDELFGGYMAHAAIPQILRAQNSWGRMLRGFAQPLLRLERYYPMMKRYRGIGALPTYLPRLTQSLLPRDEGLRRLQSFDGLVLTDTLRGELYGANLQAAWDAAHHKETTYAGIVDRSLAPDAYNFAQALVINTWLAGNALLNCDKVTMAHSLEARVPFFDPVLLNFAARVPSSIRMQRNKYVLREAMRPLLPAFALARPKQPFGTPILNWFRDDLAERIQAVLLDDGAGIRDLFQRPALEALLRAHFDGSAPQVEVVFRLLTLETWLKTFTKERVPVS